MQPKAGRTGPFAALAWWEIGVLAGWFVLLAALAEFFPRSGDDWAWGSQEGIARLHHFFWGLNGRYAGDLLILALLHIGPLAAIVVSAVVCLSLFLALHVARARTPFGYGLASVLFLTLPLGTWRQGVVWLSGFANYAMAALAFLTFLALAQAEWFGRTRRPSAARLSLVAVIAFVGQLFMEHVTFSVCVLGLALTLLLRRTQRRWGPYTVTWTIAAWVGAAVMLANPAYRHAAAGSAYQGVQATSGPHALRNLAIKALDTLNTYAVVANPVLNWALAAFLLVLALRRRRLDRLLALLSIGFIALAFGLWLAERSGHVSQRVRALAALAALLLLGALVRAAVTQVREAERRWSVLAAAAGFVLMVGPLLLVNPIGPRCFYPTYLALLVGACSLGMEARDRLPARVTKLATLPLHAVAAALLAFFFVVYVSIHQAAEQRLNRIRSEVAAGRTIIKVAPLPYGYWVHDGDPYWSLLSARFQRYYGISSSVRVILDPNPWKAKPGKPRPHIP